MKTTVKTFARFSTLGVSPMANVLYFKEGEHARTGKNIKSIGFKYFDNRFSDESSSLDSVDFSLVETKALECGFVEVPTEIGELLEEGNYWTNFSKIEKYINCPEFIERVKNSAGWDGLPVLG